MDAEEVFRDLGRIETATFYATVSDSLLAQTYQKIKKNKTYKNIPYVDATGKTKHISSLEEFCEIKLGKSARRLQQLSQNLRTLGPDLYESAEKIGFRAKDYRALKALPPEEQEVVKTAIASESKDEVIDILQDMAARHQAEKEAARKEKETAHMTISCSSCEYHKPESNPHQGKLIPGHHGKCTRPTGLCTEILESADALPRAGCGDDPALIPELTEEHAERDRAVQNSAAAVDQAVEGLSSALRGIAGDLDADINCFNELPCFVAIHNRHSEIIAINPLYLERLGDHKGQPTGAAYTPDNPQPWPVEETFASGIGMRRRMTVTYADGSRGPVMVHTAPIRDSSGQVELVVEIGADIGEVRRLQERLQATQQRYQQLFDEAPCYITVQDADLTIRAANRRFKEDFDLRVGAFCHNIYKGRDEACPDCPVTRSFADGGSHQCEMEVTSKRGETYRVLIQTAPIRDLSGSITHVMEMSTNITRTRRLEDQLASLGLMIGSVSHGIKGLLTGLDGGMYLLGAGFKKENQQQIREGWDIVRFMVGRIRDMVLDILYYAKEKDLKWETVDVFGFSKEIMHTMAPKIKAADIAFRHRIDPRIGHFQVDAGIIRSALFNIIENAVEACRSDRSGRPHEIIFEVTQDPTHICFNVSDNGVGMDEATQAKVFTPFFSSKGEHGTGLGLFISNRILKQHGGGITLTSEPGSGTRFCIKIPKRMSITTDPKFPLDYSQP